MILAKRLKELRRSVLLSQADIGAQGFISTAAWIKIENGLRSPSEKVIEQLIRWLVRDKYIPANVSSALRTELMTLKYLGSRSPFLRSAAEQFAGALPNGASFLPARRGQDNARRGNPRFLDPTWSRLPDFGNPGVFPIARTFQKRFL